MITSPSGTSSYGTSMTINGSPAVLTIDEFIQSATQRLQVAGIETARLDVLVLLEDCTAIDRAQILGHPEYTLSDVQIEQLGSRLARRAKHEPLAYIRGHSEFYGRRFEVNTDVLVPRPETETMIDQLMQLPMQPATTIYDIGTGSGAIAVTAKLECPDCAVVGIDTYQACLTIAAVNADTLSAKVEFRIGNLLEAVDLAAHGDYVLLCNLPYVPIDHTLNRAAAHEPAAALFSGSDGLDDYRMLFQQLNSMNQLPTYILTESLPEQHTAMGYIGRQHGYRLTATDGFIQVWVPNIAT